VTRGIAALLAVLALRVDALDAQTLTGLLVRGRTIALPGAIAPSLTPLALANFRTPVDSAANGRIGWSVGGLVDELQRVGTRASVRTSASRFVVHATFERAAVRHLEEISDFERTGDLVAAHDGRLETGVVTRLPRGLSAGASARYAESVLANRRSGAGEVIVSAGWRPRGFHVAFESGVVTFARASAPESERHPYGRVAFETPAFARAIRLAAGATWNELGIHRDRPLNGAAALRWEGWQQRLSLAIGGEWTPTGLAEGALELGVSTRIFRVGTRVGRQTPGLTSVQLWVATPH